MYPAVLRRGRPTVSHGHSSGCDGSRELHGDVAPLAVRAIVVRGHPYPLVHLLFDTSRAAANSLDGASMCTFLEACTHGWGAQWATHGECGQGCPRTRPRVARAFPGSAGALAGMGLWWGDVGDGQCAQGFPPTRPRVALAFLGSTGALAGTGLWWGDVGGPPPPMGGSRIGRGSRSGPD